MIVIWEGNESKLGEGMLETIRLAFFANEESCDNQSHAKYQENDRSGDISFTIHG
jgi:hypothetical protein